MVLKIKLFILCVVYIVSEWNEEEPESVHSHGGGGWYLFSVLCMFQSGRYLFCVLCMFQSGMKKSQNLSIHMIEEDDDDVECDDDITMGTIGDSFTDLSSFMGRSSSPSPHMQEENYQVTLFSSLFLPYCG